MLEKNYQTLEQKKKNKIMELQSEVKDLMKHLEVQSAVSSVDKGFREVGTSIFIGSCSSVKLL